jgi:hypothetical protein
LQAIEHNYGPSFAHFRLAHEAARVTLFSIQTNHPVPGFVNPAVVSVIPLARSPRRSLNLRSAQSRQHSPTLESVVSEQRTALVSDSVKMFETVKNCFRYHAADEYLFDCEIDHLI